MTLSRQELKIPVVIAGLDAGKRNVKVKDLVIKSMMANRSELDEWKNSSNASTQV